MSLRDEIKQAQQSVAELDQNIKMMEDVTDMQLTSLLGFTKAIKQVLHKVHFKKLETLTLDEMKEVLEMADDADTKGKLFQDLSEQYEKAINDPDDTTIPKDQSLEDYIRTNLIKAKNSIMHLMEMRIERDKLNENLTNVTHEYYKALNSPENRDKKLAKLAEMQEQAEKESDPAEKRKVMDQIVAMTSAESLAFLTADIDATTPPRKGVKVGQAAIDNLAEVYLDNRRSAMVLNKFKARMPRFGYNKNIYTRFFNIEENFLPEEYHKFNNLFLFHVMRTISFMDTYSKVDTLYASTILHRVYNLVYHQYATPEMEAEFVDYIRKFLDQFVEKWSDRFEECNISAPNHAVNKKMREEADAKRRMHLINTILAHGGEPDTTWETAELREYLEKIIKESNDARKAELAEWIAERKAKQEEAADETDEENILEADAEDASEPVISEGEPVESSEAVKVLVETLPPTEAPGDLEKLMDAIDNSAEVAEFDKEQEAIADELAEGRKRAQELLKNSDKITEPESVVTEKRTITQSKPESPESDTIYKDVYVDTFGYYYMKHDGDDGYDYYTREHTIHEANVDEDTVLKLACGGSLRKACCAITKS